MNKIRSISGFQLSHAKRVCEYVFGEYLHSVKINNNNVCFEIIIFNFIQSNTYGVREAVNIDNFVRHFGVQWRVIIVNENK